MAVHNNNNRPNLQTFVDETPTVVSKSAGIGALCLGNIGLAALGPFGAAAGVLAGGGLGLYYSINQRTPQTKEIEIFGTDQDTLKVLDTIELSVEERQPKLQEALPLLQQIKNLTIRAEVFVQIHQENVSKEMINYLCSDINSDSTDISIYQKVTELHYVETFVPDELMQSFWKSETNEDTLERVVNFLSAQKESAKSIEDKLSKIMIMSEVFTSNAIHDIRQALNLRSSPVNTLGDVGELSD